MPDSAADSRYDFLIKLGISQDSLKDMKSSVQEALNDALSSIKIEKAVITEKGAKDLSKDIASKIESQGGLVFDNLTISAKNITMKGVANLKLTGLEISTEAEQILKLQTSIQKQLNRMNNFRIKVKADLDKEDFLDQMSKAGWVLTNRGGSGAGKPKPTGNIEGTENLNPNVRMASRTSNAFDEKRGIYTSTTTKYDAQGRPRVGTVRARGKDTSATYVNTDIEEQQKELKESQKAFDAYYKYVEDREAAYTEYEKRELKEREGEERAYYKERIRREKELNELFEKQKLDAENEARAENARRNKQFKEQQAEEAVFLKEKNKQRRESEKVLNDARKRDSDQLDKDLKNLEKEYNASRAAAEKYDRELQQLNKDIEANLNISERQANKMRANLAKGYMRSQGGGPGGFYTDEYEKYRDASIPPRRGLFGINLGRASDEEGGGGFAGRLGNRAVAVGAGVLLSGLYYQIINEIGQGFHDYVRASVGQKLIGTYIESVTQGIAADRGISTQAASRVLGGGVEVNMDRVGQTAIQLSNTFGIAVNDVQQTLGLWLKQMQDINQATLMTREALKFQTLTGTDNEVTQRLMTAIAQQSGGSGPADWKTARAVMAAATIAGTRYGMNLKDLDEGTGGAGINNPNNAALQTLEGLSKGGLTVGGSLGYNPMYMVALYTMMQQRLATTAPQFEQNFGSIIERLSSGKSIEFLNKMGINVSRGGNLFETLAANKDKLTQGNLAEIGVKSQDYAPFLTLLDAIPSVAKVVKDLGDLSPENIKKLQERLDELFKTFTDNNLEFQLNRVRESFRNTVIAFFQALLGGDNFAQTLKNVADWLIRSQRAAFEFGKVVGFVALALGGAAQIIGGVGVSIWNVVKALRGVMATLADNAVMLVGKILSGHFSEAGNIARNFLVPQRGDIINNQNEAVRGLTTAGSWIRSGWDKLSYSAYAQLTQKNPYDTPGYTGMEGVQPNPTAKQPLPDLTQDPDKLRKKQEQVINAYISMQKKLFDTSVKQFEDTLKRIDARQAEYSQRTEDVTSKINILSAAESRLNGIYKERILSIEMIARQTELYNQQIDVRKQYIQILKQENQENLKAINEIGRAAARIIKPNIETDINKIPGAVVPGATTGTPLTSGALPNAQGVYDTTNTPIALTIKKFVDTHPLLQSHFTNLRPPTSKAYNDLNAFKNKVKPTTITFSNLPVLKNVTPVGVYSDRKTGITYGQPVSGLKPVAVGTAMASDDAAQANLDNAAQGQINTLDSANNRAKQEQIKLKKENQENIIKQYNTETEIFKIENAILDQQMNRAKQINDYYNYLSDTKRTFDPLFGEDAITQLNEQKAKIDSQRQLYGETVDTLTDTIRLNNTGIIASTEKYFQAMDNYQKNLDLATSSAKAAELVTRASLGYEVIANQPGISAEDKRKQMWSRTWKLLSSDPTLFPLLNNPQFKAFAQSSNPVEGIVEFSKQSLSNYSRVNDLRKNATQDMTEATNEKILNTARKNILPLKDIIRDTANEMDYFNTVIDYNISSFENLGKTYEGSSLWFANVNRNIEETRSAYDQKLSGLNKFLSTTNLTMGRLGVYGGIQNPVLDIATMLANVQKPEIANNKSKFGFTDEEYTAFIEALRSLLESAKLMNNAANVLVKRENIIKERYRTEDELSAAMAALPSLTPAFSRYTDILSSRRDIITSRYRDAYQAYLTAGKDITKLTDTDRGYFENGPGQIASLNSQIYGRQLVQNIRDGVRQGFQGFFQQTQRGNLKGGFGGLISSFQEVYRQAISESMTKRFIEPLLDAIPGFKESRMTPAEKATIDSLSVLRSIDSTLKGNPYSKTTNYLGGVNKYSNGNISGLGNSDPENGTGPILYGADGKPIKTKGRTGSFGTNLANEAMKGLAYYSAGKGAWDAGANGGPLQGAVGGALSGAAFGPLGIAIGGVLGLFGGLFGQHHAPKDPKEYDNIWTPKDVMWAAPGYRPFSAYAGGRAVTGAPVNVDVKVNINRDGSYNVATSIDGRRTTEVVGDAYGRERQLGTKGGINA